MSHCSARRLQEDCLTYFKRSATFAIECCKAALSVDINGEQEQAKGRQQRTEHSSEDAQPKSLEVASLE